MPRTDSNQIRRAAGALSLLAMLVPATASADLGHLWEGTFTDADELRDALEQADDGVHLATNAQNEWAVVDGDRATFSSGLAWAPGFVVQYLLDRGYELDAVDMFGTSGYAIITGRSVVASPGLAGVASLRQFVRDRAPGEEITAFGVRSNGEGWAIATDQSYATHGVGDDVEVALYDAFASGRVPTAVTFAPDDAFIVAAGPRIVTGGLSGTVQRLNLGAFQRLRMSIDAVILGPGGGLGVYGTFANPDAGRPIAAIEGVGGSLWKTMIDNGVPGLSVAYWDNGEVMVRGYGVAQATSDRPVTVDTPFLWASMSKYVTGLMAARLEEQGAVDLDDTLFEHSLAHTDGEVADWMRAIRSNGYPLGGSVDGARLEQVLSMTAGIQGGSAFYEPEPTGETFWISAGARLRGFDITGFQNNGLVMPDAAPGSWRYSNDSLQVGGAVIEDVTGMNFAEATADLVFEPLGMGDSFVAAPTPLAARPDLAWPHLRGGAPRTQRFGIGFSAAAGLGGPARDFLQVLVPLVNDGNDARGNRFIDGDTITEILADRDGSAGRHYGLGIYTDTTGRSYHTGGFFQGYMARFEVDRERGRAIVIVANIGDRGFRDTVMRDAAAAFMNAP